MFGAALRLFRRKELRAGVQYRKPARSGVCKHPQIFTMPRSEQAGQAAQTPGEATGDIMLIRSICSALMLCAAMASQADELTEAKRSDIKKLIASTGSDRIAAQFAGAVTQSLSHALKAAHPDLPERIFVSIRHDLTAMFTEKMNAPEGMIDRVVPVYHKHFTHDEIRELLAFYQTAIGRKAIDVLPNVVGESTAIGQAWGRGLAPDIRRLIDAALGKEGIQMPGD